MLLPLADVVDDRLVAVVRLHISQCDALVRVLGHLDGVRRVRRLFDQHSVVLFALTVGVGRKASERARVFPAGGARVQLGDQSVGGLLFGHNVSLLEQRVDLHAFLQPPNGQRLLTVRRAAQTQRTALLHPKQIEAQLEVRLNEHLQLNHFGQFVSNAVSTFTKIEAGILLANLLYGQ